MSIVNFNVAAKTDVGLVRKNNEDNFAVVPDLVRGLASDDGEINDTLGRKGALLVVADGMGGMNAGEVASRIAVESLCSSFAPERLTPDVMASDATVARFMEGALEDADRRIKTTSQKHAEGRGMGTTAVVAWILGRRLHVAWCGDSRAYLYGKVSGLRQVSRDHSYVQELVDQGLITQEETYTHPRRNIITRALSDTPREPRPESLPESLELHEGDIVLLCTDGLNGLMRDDDMAQVISKHQSDMKACADALIQAALKRGGGDNVTVVLCRIASVKE
jgi:serine/threonine protein phosphatase PrpC